MRLMTLAAAAAALSLTPAPLAAQAAPQPTMKESIECMLVTLPFLMVATIDDPASVEGLDQVGTFWAELADSNGEAAEDEMAAVEAEGLAMIEGFEKLDSSTDFAAYLEPYRARFDACEEKRRAILSQ